MDAYASTPRVDAYAPLMGFIGGARAKHVVFLYLWTHLRQGKETYHHLRRILT